MEPLIQSPEPDGSATKKGAGKNYGIVETTSGKSRGCGKKAHGPFFLRGGTGLKSDGKVINYVNKGMGSRTRSKKESGKDVGKTHTSKRVSERMPDVCRSHSQKSRRVKKTITGGMGSSQQLGTCKEEVERIGQKNLAKRKGHKTAPAKGRASVEMQVGIRISKTGSAKKLPRGLSSAL